MSTDWSIGSEYSGGWWRYLSLLAPTIIMNLIVIILVTFSNLNKSGESHILRYLLFEDVGFSVCCLIQCAINLSHLEIYGEEIGCRIQSFYATFFVLACGYSLCVIAYNIDLKINMKQALTKSQIFKIHLGIWAWASFISSLTSYLFDPRLMPSGTYCLSSLVNLGSGLLFYIPGVGVIGLFLIHRYLKIYLKIKNVANNLISGQHEAHQRGRKASKKMLVFVICYFLCALPVLVLSLTEIIAKISLSPALHLMAGHLVHVNSLLDPVLYFWLNPNSRKMVYDYFSKNQKYEINSSKIIISPKIVIQKSELLTVQKDTDLSTHSLPYPPFGLANCNTPETMINRIF